MFVARQAALPDPFKTQWNLGHLDPTDVEFVVTQLMFNYAEACLEGPWGKGSAHMEVVPSFPASSCSRPGPVQCPHLHLGPMSSPALVLCLESPDLLSAWLDSALPPGDPADRSQDPRPIPVQVGASPFPGQACNREGGRSCN